MPHPLSPNGLATFISRLRTLREERAPTDHVPVPLGDFDTMLAVMEEALLETRRLDMIECFVESVADRSPRDTKTDEAVATEWVVELIDDGTLPVVPDRGLRATLDAVHAHIAGTST